MQPIISVPHQTLRKKSTPIGNITLAIQKQVEELVDTMVKAHDPEGVGLSFPQIGLNLRGFVTYLEKRIKVYLNPVILDMSEEKTLGGTPERPTLEGCLSIPWLYGPVWRPKKIKIQALDEHGTEFSKTLSSFPARLTMHEYDHLEGVVFTDYTLRDQLPLYLLDREHDKFVQIQDPSTVIKW
ncbi:peptide deformylase [Candidatus Collierbacteria bacterium CG10_big_fil_rev_8_21_14_0_10_44_9]|uniref:Peptide deformylase n=1 Tax=Candidatus Collierbacteria bacterium CG10_big_fil_rev_8_21_14_0_10_44_9 TaxID=1974535 RepID=A0A2H0VJB7_9BACT|nr:MAG: peptide deformylase [Candidatus Collierbacteria bacterium CG10_big_fil_rev_8_21_14_0_10_44_9]